MEEDLPVTPLSHAPCCQPNYELFLWWVNHTWTWSEWISKHAHCWCNTILYTVTCVHKIISVHYTWGTAQEGQMGQLQLELSELKLQRLLDNSLPLTKNSSSWKNPLMGCHWSTPYIMLLSNTHNPTTICFRAWQLGKAVPCDWQQER